MPRKLNLLLTASLVAAGCSARMIDVQHRFRAPPGVSVGEQWVSPDSCCAETPFTANATKGDMSAANAVDEQLQSLGYSRCNHSAEDWETFRINRGGAGTEHHIRLLRFYRIEEHGRMATVVAYEQCDGSSQNCEQRFRVRLTDFPRALAERERLIDAVCSGESAPVTED